jgi:hypothetical protein
VVVSEQEGAEARDAVGARKRGETEQENGPDTLALKTISHRERHLGECWITFDDVVPPDASDLPVDETMSAMRPV